MVVKYVHLEMQNKTFLECAKESYPGKYLGENDLALCGKAEKTKSIRNILRRS